MLNLGFYYEFPYLDGYSNVTAYSYVYTGIKFRLKDNLTVALTANDLFKTNHAKQTMLSDGVNYVNDNIPDSRNFRLSITYRLGNKKMRAEQHNAGNDEVRGRIP